MNEVKTALFRHLATCALFMLCAGAYATAPKLPSGLRPGTTTSPGPSTESATVQLSWSGVAGASYYQLGVRDLTSQQLVVSTTVQGATSYTATLVPNRPYRWNINACNSKNECSKFTEVLYFQTPAPKPVMYSLSTRITGSGSGSIACGTGTCAPSYAVGTKVRVTANAAPASEFQSLTGCDGSTISRSSCIVTMSANKAISASFSVTQYGLQIKRLGTGSGTVSCNGAACTNAYAAKTGLTLLATPDAGSKFSAWSGCTALPANPASCKLTMDAQKVVEATFIKISPTNFELKFGTTGGGSGSVGCQTGGKSCASGTRFASGTEITLNASAAQGSVFNRWENCPSPSGSTCKVTVKADLMVNANFNLDVVRISPEKPIFGSITFKGSGCDNANCSTARRGTFVTATATADPGYVFLQWTKCPSGQTTSTSCTFQANNTQPLELKAMFARPIPMERVRMSETTKHFGVHAWLRLRDETQIDAWAQGVKDHVFGKSSTDAFKQSTDKKRIAQLSAQVELSAKNYALDPDRALKNISNAVNSLYRNGIVPHLVLSVHDVPKQAWPQADSDLMAVSSKWKLDNQPDGDFSDFLPYQPCLERKSTKGSLCPYDQVFENFHTPVIKYLVNSGIADRIAVIYVFNEFDYPNVSKETTIQTKHWKANICGTMNAMDCRAKALANTTKRGLKNAADAVIAAKGQVPIGLKFADMARRSDASAWTYDGRSNLSKDYLQDLIHATIIPNGMVIGYDCYTPWWKGARAGTYTPEKTYCAPDAQRFNSIIASSTKPDYLKQGKFEITEYNRVCEKGDFGEKTAPGVALIKKEEMAEFPKQFPAASGFSLFGFGVIGDTTGCYSLGYFPQGPTSTPEDNKTGLPIFYDKNYEAWAGLAEQIKNHVGK